MSKPFILDACALIALLNHENGADKVMAAYEKIKNGGGEILINRINLLEVYYGFYHTKGREYAGKVLDEITKSAISISEFNQALFMEAGRLKASYRISLADSIVLAQAIVTGGELLTADHHEFDPIEGKEPVHFHWIR